MNNGLPVPPFPQIDIDVERFKELMENATETPKKAF